MNCSNKSPFWEIQNLTVRQSDKRPPPLQKNNNFFTYTTYPYFSRTWSSFPNSISNSRFFIHFESRTRFTIFTVHLFLKCSQPSNTPLFGVRCFWYWCLNIVFQCYLSIVRVKGWKCLKMVNDATQFIVVLTHWQFEFHDIYCFFVNISWLIPESFVVKMHLYSKNILKTNFWWSLKRSFLLNVFLKKIKDWIFLYFI